MKKLLIITVFLLSFSVNGFGSELKCNSAQSFCITKNKRLTIGDKIGIFNDYNELLATSKVNKMHGKKRRLSIKNKYGLITKKAKLVRLTTLNQNTLKEKYKIYKDTPLNVIGGSFGIANFDVGDNGNTFVVNGFYEKLWDYNIRLLGRGFFLKSSGDASDVRNDSEVTYFDIYGFGGLAGASISFFTKNTFSLRTELSLGGSYLVKNLDGPENCESLNKIEDGFGLVYRLQSGVYYNGDFSFHPKLATSIIGIQQTINAELTLGLLKDF